MANSPNPMHRSLRIDAIRGIAVIGMIIAHAIFFFHDNSSTVLQSLAQFLNTTVITLFVFVSGLSLSRFLDSTSHLGYRHLAAKVLKRSGLFYITFCIAATAALVSTVPGLPTSELLVKLPSALTMLEPPSFTEYIPLFVLLSLSIFPLRNLFIRTRQSILMTIITGGFAYTSGILLFPLDFRNLEPLKLLFVGGGTALRFPVLFYFPVLLWGLWWQHFIDHAPLSQKTYRARMMILFLTAGVSLLGIVISRQYYIPIIDPLTRWPPSITYLTTGIALSMVLMSFARSTRYIGVVTERIIVYFGRDALDLWISHLLLLFLYRRFIGTQFTNIPFIFILVICLIVLSVAISSLTLTNRISFPLQLTWQGATRFRIRYVIFSVIIGVILLLSLNPQITGNSQFGNFMVTDPLTVQKKLPQQTRLQLTTDRTWYTLRNPDMEIIDITVQASTGGTPITLNPNAITITIANTVKKLTAIGDPDGPLHYPLVLSDFSPGVYPITAKIENGDMQILSNTVTINISEPFLVAFTFDWEGWDASDSALMKLDELGSVDASKFTHFVNPRTFLPGILSPARKDTITSFLHNRHTKGDEIALHIHMHYDLVKAAGVAPRTTNPWGFYMRDGYDIPITEYSPEEFRSILTFSKNLATESGMPDPRGFRAGGWFLSDNYLQVLADEHFSYDSSGRDKPTSGPFSSLPWNLPVGSQPFIVANTVLEIPNNGVATSESTSAQILARARGLYPGGILQKPKTFVVTTHPQFATREFPRISEVLLSLVQESIYKDKGPILFVTMSDIYSLWTSNSF